jgi:hypothetical protein
MADFFEITRREFIRNSPLFRARYIGYRRHDRKSGNISSR